MNGIRLVRVFFFSLRGELDELDGCAAVRTKWLLQLFRPMSGPEPFNG